MRLLYRTLIYFLIFFVATTAVMIIIQFLPYDNPIRIFVYGVELPNSLTPEDIQSIQNENTDMSNWTIGTS